MYRRYVATLLGLNSEDTNVAKTTDNKPDRPDVPEEVKLEWQRYETRNEPRCKKICFRGF